MNNISFTASATHNPTNKLIDCINSITIIAYLGLILLEFRRYVIEADFRFYIVNLRFLFLIILLFIGLFKILYYFKQDIKYSLFALALYIFTAVFFFIKNNYSVWNIISNWPNMATAIILTVAVYKIPLAKIIRSFFITMSTLFIIRVLGALVGILPSNNYPDHDNSNDLGFGNHNLAMICFFFLVLCLIYLTRAYANRTVLGICILVISILLFIVTKSKTSTSLLVLASIAIILLSMIEIKANTSLKNIFYTTFSKVTRFSPLLFVFISISGIIAYSYWTYVTHEIHDTTFLARFLYFYEDCQYNGILLPWSILIYDTKPYFNWIMGGQVYMPYSDNTCHSLLIPYGIVYFVIVITAFQLWANFSYRRKEYSMLLIIGLLSVFCIMEAHALTFFWNPFLIIAFADFGKSEAVIRNELNITNHTLPRSAWKSPINKYIKYSLITTIIIYVCFSVYLLSSSLPLILSSGIVPRRFYLWMVITVGCVLLIDKLFSIHEANA